MATYSLTDLLGMWARQELSILQAIGHMLQHLARQEKEIEDLKRQVLQLSRQVKQLGEAPGQSSG